MDNQRILEALADETSAKILLYTTEQERSADELAELVEASPSTVYRRLDALVEQALLTEGLQLDHRGNHRNVYRAAIKRIEVELSDETLEMDVERREDEVDRFVRLWEDIRE